MSTQQYSLIFECFRVGVHSKLNEIIIEIHDLARLMASSGDFPVDELQELRCTADSLSDVAKSLAINAN